MRDSRTSDEGIDQIASFFDDVLNPPPAQSVPADRGAGESRTNEEGARPPPNTSSHSPRLSELSDTEHPRADESGPVPSGKENRRAGRSVGAFVLAMGIASAILGFSVCYVLFGRPPSGPGAPRPAAKVEPQPSAREVNANAEGSAGAPPAATRRAVLPPSAAAPVFEAQPMTTIQCRATILTQPSGALLRWQGKLVGETPFEDAPISCGRGTLVVKRQGYGRIVKTLVLRADAPLLLRERLLHKSRTANARGPFVAPRGTERGRGRIQHELDDPAGAVRDIAARLEYAIRASRKNGAPAARP